MCPAPFPPQRSNAHTQYDIMGHLMLDTVVKCRDQLAALTLDRHGVDGGRTYLYGEAWDWYVCDS